MAKLGLPVVQITVYCNMVHGKRPTKMKEREPRSKNNPFEHHSDKMVFTCPICKTDGVVVAVDPA